MGLGVLATTTNADAAAGQRQAGARAGAAWLEKARWGPAANVFLRHGLGDSLDLDVEVSASLHPFQPDAKMAAGAGGSGPSFPWFIGFCPGLTYRWDVLRVIPYAGASAGLYASDGLVARDGGLQFGASGRAGVEYLLSRDVVLSGQVSAHFALTDSPIPWIQVSAGAGYVWGW